jgi:hypothetical protein
LNKFYSLFALTFPFFLFAQQTPLSIEPASLIEPGYAQTDIGISYLHNQSFPLSGLTGNLYKVGNIRFSMSLSEYVELQTEGTLLDLLYVQSRKPAFNSSFASTNNPTGDIGDFSLWTKFSILREYRSGVALSVKFGVQLPNASNESGLGIDEMNFYSSFLIEKHIGGLLIANVGLGILSDPTKVGSQHDVCMYGIRYVLPIGGSTFAIAQYAGRAGHSGVGVNGLRSWKTGIEQSFGDIAVRVSAIKNNSIDDKAMGVECMMMYLFHAVEIP